MQKNSTKLLGGILLVSGTTIGAGMLALPVISGFAGFLPSVFLLLIFWIYMTYTALLILEVNLSLDKTSNLIVMAKKTLGYKGEWVSWIAYLFLLYSLTTAYLAGGGPIITEFFESLTDIHLPTALGILPLFGLFGFFVFKGTRSVDLLNRLLMLALALSYFLVVIFVAPFVETSKLLYVDIQYLFFTIAIVATSFGFHIIIPSLVNYFDKDVASLKKAIWIGGLIPLFIYILWEMLTLGVIPVTGINSIESGFLKAHDGAHLLAEQLNNPHINLAARFFSFFAIVTSFLGVSLSLFDCLGDSLKVEKTFSGRLILFALTFIPPLIIALIDPRIFLIALNYAGAFGVIILLGLMPALMAYEARYKKHFSSSYKAPGGKKTLLLSIAFSVFVILLECVKQFWN